MVYEVKCSECDKIMEFGGKEPSDFSGEDKLPENAIEFQGETYCRECIRELVMFGVGDIQERLKVLEDRVQEIMDAMDMGEGLNKGENI